MKEFIKIYTSAYMLLVLCVFFIGGFLQFFIGIPNTVFTYAVLTIFFVAYLAYAGLTGRIVFDRVVFLFSLLAVLVLVSGLANRTSILKILIYMIFIAVPLGAYLFFRINHKENYISTVNISKLFLFIALLQLPVILIQHVGYDFLIDFNRSSQEVKSFDFLFGTFFLKADHALGFFLLMNLVNVTSNNQNNRITRFPKFVFLYLAFTILIAESNITKLLLVLFFIYTIYNSFPRRIKLFGVIAALILTPILYAQLMKIEAFETEMHFVEKEYNPKKSFSNYNRGIAKRPQVAIVFATKLPLKIVGEGPYSYFDVLKSRFTKTKHFSQLIWTYADLGIIGLIILILLLYSLTLSLGLSVGTRNIVFLMIMVYAFMTTIFSDLAIMITFTSLLQLRKVSE